MLDNAFDRKSAPDAGDETIKGNVTNRALPLAGGYNPAEAEAVDIFRLLDQLEDLPEKAKHGPFNTLLGFDHEQFYYLVLKIRANLPDDLKKAQRVARESERIVDEARDVAIQQMESGRAEASRLLDDSRLESQRLVDQAREQAAQMVERSEVHRMAVAQAHEIIRQAETEAAEIRKGADDYARDVLTNLEAVMGKAMGTIQRGRETLERSRG